MYLLASSLTIVEIILFSLAVVAFMLSVSFFIQSKKSLKHLLPKHKPKKNLFRFWFDRNGFIVPPKNKTEPTPKQENFSHLLYERDKVTQQEIKELKAILQTQQQEISKAIYQIASLSSRTEQAAYAPVSMLDEDEYVEDEDEDEWEGGEQKVEELELLLDTKEKELKDLRQHVELSQRVQHRFEEVQTGYEELQHKVQAMEEQAWQSADVAIKFNSLEQSNEQLEKTLQKKEERVRELTLENGRLMEALHQTEDKLTEANLQRQQLIKKVNFLENINTDMQQITDSNRKLKTELRRVAELESMLALILEERDVLLKRKKVN